MNGSPSPHEPQRLRVVHPRQPLPADPALRHLTLATRGEELRRRGQELARLRLQAERDARDDRRAFAFVAGITAVIVIGMGLVVLFGGVSLSGF